MTEGSTPSEFSDATTSRQPTAKWGLERRLEFIDFRLRWDGRLNRVDLKNFFGVSTPQASLDIAKYLEMAPENAIYDRSQRVYLATSSFQPLFQANEPSRYLSELLARATGLLPAELSFFGWAPAVASAPVPARTLSAEVLSGLLAAIRTQRAVSILYQSMSTPEPSERVIHPHALGFDGFRWHVRGFCRTRERYLDFVIARMLSLKPLDEPGTDGANDNEWAQVVRLVLTPNPLLPPAARSAIALDYGMTDGEVTLECKQALLFYTLEKLGLNATVDADPKRHQIVLKNASEVLPHIVRVN